MKNKKEQIAISESVGPNIPSLKEIEEIYTNPVIPDQRQIDLQEYQETEEVLVEMKAQEACLRGLFYYPGTVEQKVSACTTAFAEKIEEWIKQGVICLLLPNPLFDNIKHYFKHIALPLLHAGILGSETEQEVLSQALLQQQSSLLAERIQQAEANREIITPEQIAIEAGLTSPYRRFERDGVMVLVDNENNLALLINNVPVHKLTEFKLKHDPQLKGNAPEARCDHLLNQIIFNAELILYSTDETIKRIIAHEVTHADSAAHPYNVSQELLEKQLPISMAILYKNNPRLGIQGIRNGIMRGFTLEEVRAERGIELFQEAFNIDPEFLDEARQRKAMGLYRMTIECLDKIFRQYIVYLLARKGPLSDKERKAFVQEIYQTETSIFNSITKEIETLTVGQLMSVADYYKEKRSRDIAFARTYQRTGGLFGHPFEE